MTDLGNIENWTKIDCARVVCQALYNADKPLSADHFQVRRMMRHSKPELVRRAEQSIEIISRRRMAALDKRQEELEPTSEPKITIPESEYNALFDTMLGLKKARMEAEEKALKSLRGYKFEMFGYWAAAWVKYNQRLPREMRDSNPFRELVKKAREMHDTLMEEKYQ